MNLMDDFNPGPGWRQAAWNEDYQHVPHIIVTGEPGEGSKLFLQEIPANPLPTEPYTVIRVTPPAKYPGAEPMLYVHNGKRFAAVSLNSWLDVSNVEDWADFEVERLGEPIKYRLGETYGEFEARIRREVAHETAKAVLDEVLQLDSWNDGIPISKIEALARDYEAQP